MASAAADEPCCALSLSSGKGCVPSPLSIRVSSMPSEFQVPVNGACEASSGYSVSALPGSPIADKLAELAGDLIWVARDNADNIREVSEERWQRLQALADQREKGELGEEEYLEKRSTLIHDKAVE